MCVFVCVGSNSKGQHRGIEVNETSLVPRLLPDFILQLWRKIGKMPGTITTSQTENGGLSFAMMVYATNLKQK